MSAKTTHSSSSATRRATPWSVFGAGFLATAMLTLGAAVCVGTHADSSEQLISDRAFGIAALATPTPQPAVFSQRG